MYTFELITAEDGVQSIKKIAQDGTIWWLPKDPANTDYQEYLKWLEEGNQPEPAEQP